MVGVSVADGEPANDIPGFGVQLRYALSDQWSVGAGLGRTEYDFETPASILGIAQDPSMEPVDALATATTFRAGRSELSFPTAAKPPGSWDPDSARHPSMFRT